MHDSLGPKRVEYGPKAVPVNVSAAAADEKNHSLHHFATARTTNDGTP